MKTKKEKALEKKLKIESKLVREDSMKVLAEFEALKPDYEF